MPVTAVSPPAATAEPVPSPVAGAKRQVDYFRVDAAKLDDLIRLMGEIVSEHGRSRRQIGRLREIERAMELDNFMTPDEAKEFGLIDQVVASRPATGTDPTP